MAHTVLGEGGRGECSEIGRTLELADQSGNTVSKKPKVNSTEE